MAMLLAAIGVRRLLVVWSVAGTTGEWGRSGARRAEAGHCRWEGVLRTLGGVLPAGLVGDGCFVAGCILVHTRAARASVATGFATVSKCGLVVWRIARYRRARYEQLSADDGH